MSTWEVLEHRITADAVLGLLPEIIQNDDPRSAIDQINERYAHGGGWNEFHGFTMRNGALCYPEDPPYRPVAQIQLSETPLRKTERVVLYAHAWVAIILPDDSYRVARMD